MKTDMELKKAVEEELVINNGWVTLEGQVDWQYQKNAAGRAVRYLTGVTGVSNNIAQSSRIDC